MPYKMIGTMPTPFDAFSSFEASRLATTMAKEAGYSTAQQLYLGRPDRKIGQIIQTKEEVRYDKGRFIPERLQRWWHKKFPLRSSECGVYVEV